MEVVDVIKVLSDAGVVGLLVIILVGGSRGWWVFGRTYEDKVKECNAWRDLALKGTTIAEKMADKS